MRYRQALYNILARFLTVLEFIEVDALYYHNIIVLLNEDIDFGCFQQKILKFDVCSEIFLVKLIFYSINDLI